MDRPLPYNIEQEQALLGAVMFNGDIESVSKVLEANDFYSLPNREIYKAMLSLRAEGEKIDPVTVAGYMRRSKPDFETTTLMAMVSGVPVGPVITEYPEKIKQYAVSRDLILHCNRIQNELLMQVEPVPNLIQDLEQVVLALNNKVHLEKRDEQAFYGLDEIVPNLEDQFTRMHEGIITGVRTGMKELDNKLDGGGLQPGGLYLIGASEKAGKTSIMLDWAYHMSMLDGYTTPIVTLEMSRVTMAKRIYSSHMGIPYTLFRAGFKDTKENNNAYTRAMKGLREFGNIPIIIADKIFGFNNIARWVRRIVERSRKDALKDPTKKPIGVVMLDYLQLITWDGEKAQTREREVANVSRELKKLAAELGIAVVVVTAINRDGLKEGLEPTSLNLRESGQLAYDAEAVLLLFNPSFIPGKPYEPRDITDMVLIIDRQRNGPTGRIPMKFIGPYMQFMTESQFAKQWGDRSVDKQLPETVGQTLQNNEQADADWDNKDEEDWGI